MGIEERTNSTPPADVQRAVNMYKLALDRRQSKRVCRSAREYLELVGRTIPSATDKLLEEFLAEQASDAVRKGMRATLRGLLTWAAREGYQCDVAALPRCAEDYLDTARTPIAQARVGWHVRAWMSYLVQRGLLASESVQHLCLQRRESAWERARSVSPRHGQDLNAFDMWLQQEQRAMGVTDHTRDRVREAVAHLCLDHHQALKKPVGALTDILVDVSGVATWLRDYRSHRLDLEQQDVSESRKRRILTSLQWAYDWLDATLGPATPDRFEQLKGLLKSRRGGVRLGGRISPRRKAPSRARVEAILEELNWEIQRESVRCGFVSNAPGTWARASYKLIRLLRARAMLEIAITSMTRLETLATIDLRLIERRKNHLIARNVRRKRTRSNSDPTTDWVLFLRPWQEHVEAYLHSTGRCLAVGLEGCYEKPRLGPIHRIAAGEAWGNRPAERNMEVCALWVSAHSNATALTYDGVRDALEVWVKRIGPNVRVHDLRRYGAVHAFKSGWSIPEVKRVGQWEDHRTLIQVYSEADEQQVYDELGSKSIAAQSTDNRASDPCRTGVFFTLEEAEQLAEALRFRFPNLRELSDPQVFSTVFERPVTLSDAPAPASQEQATTKRRVPKPSSSPLGGALRAALIGRSGGRT